MVSRKSIVFILLFFVVAMILILIYQKNQSSGAHQHAGLPSYVKAYNFEQIEPVPLTINLPPETVELGRQLFYSTILSADNSTACASCHQLDKAGADARKFPLNMKAQIAPINTPTIFNSAFNYAQFWDGRYDSLEDVIAEPFHKLLNVSSDWPEIITRLRADSHYQELFQQIFPDDGVNRRNAIHSLAVYVRSLVTPNSRFDQYLFSKKKASDAEILNTHEREGYALFINFGCISCHQGVNIGGNMFQRFGVFDGYFKNRKLVKSDLGRYNVSDLEEDRYVFKVPSLRNVAVTAPYFHDGSVDTLENAVLIMGRYQLGRQLSEDELRYLIAFLKSLTGQWQGKVLQ